MNKIVILNNVITVSAASDIFLTTPILLLVMFAALSIVIPLQLFQSSLYFPTTHSCSDLNISDPVVYVGKSDDTVNLP